MKRTLTLVAVLLGASTTLHAQYAVQYGAAVAVNDGQIIVGEGRQLLLPGNVFVYDMEDDGTWSQAQVLTPGGERAIGFGQSLAADHTTLVIGAPLADEVHIYSREDDGTWSPFETITLSHARFGSSLALKGDQLIIGAAGGQDVTGGAYLYIKNDDNGWRLAEELTPEDISETDGYGRSVAIHGNEFIVGAPRWNDGEGRAFVYSYNDTGEQQIDEMWNGERIGWSTVCVVYCICGRVPGTQCAKARWRNGRPLFQKRQRHVGADAYPGFTRYNRRPAIWRSIGCIR